MIGHRVEQQDAQCLGLEKLFGRVTAQEVLARRNSTQNQPDGHSRQTPEQIRNHQGNKPTLEFPDEARGLRFERPEKKKPGDEKKHRPVHPAQAVAHQPLEEVGDREIRHQFVPAVEDLVIGRVVQENDEDRAE